MHVRCPDCGTSHLTNAGMRAGLKAKVLGHDAEVDNMEFGEISSGFDQSLKEDVAFLKANPFIKKDMKIHGYLWDIKTGELTTDVDG
ncbi:hypothetical protein MMC17_002814 [Xylographa soralifera]|nr:hypothetical protein [Xylographa soralifera]